MQIEWFNDFWGWTIPVGGGITVGALFIGIIKAVGAKIVTKVQSRLDVTLKESDIADKVTAKVTEKLQNMSFKQNIAPIVQSELAPIADKLAGAVGERLGEVLDGYSKLLACFKALSAYFDNSIAITGDQKEALHSAISEAEGVIKPEIEAVVEITEEIEKAVKKAKSEVVR